MTINRRHLIVRREKDRAAEEQSIDPRIANILHCVEGARWKVKCVDLPTPSTATADSLTIHVHFIIRPAGETDWRVFCHRMLLAGNQMGLSIQQILKLEGKVMVSDWIISFCFVADKAEDFEVRMLEAVQRFTDILKVAR